MRVLVSCIIVAFALVGCGGNSSPTSTPALPTSTPITPTSAPAPVSTQDTMSQTAQDWANMDSGQRAESAAYWLDYWKKQGNETAQTADTLQVCITEEVIQPGEPLTMLIMAISSRCIQK